MAAPIHSAARLRDTDQLREYLIDHHAQLFHAIRSRDIGESERLLSLHVSDQSMILRYIEGGLGAEFGLGSAEKAVGALCQRGFEPEAALRLLEGVVNIASAAAIRNIHVRNAQKAGRPHRAGTLSVLQNAAPGQFKYMKGLAETYADESQFIYWHDILLSYLSGIATQRGEVLDPGGLPGALET